MTNERYIGIMTGNSMDAIDLVVTDFSGGKIQDICAGTSPYSAEQKKQIDGLRQRVISCRMSAAELCGDEEFQTIHRRYIEGVAAAVEEMLSRNKIEKKTVRAIGFHGKTLDHNPPSIARRNATEPYTIQMGSGQLLANLTGLPVVNDFRSDLLMAGYEGAPLAGPHNARIARLEEDGCYFNAGNTSNLSWVKQGKSVISWDAGPFNEYTDNFILRYKNETMDADARYGVRGRLLPELLQKLFDFGRDYYEMLLPKSGDPAYYKTSALFADIEKKYGNPSANEQLFCDIIHTLEYFSGYLAAYAVAQTPERIDVPPRFILFGGGWKNPVACAAFKDVLCGNGLILPEHRKSFEKVRERWSKEMQITYSQYGAYMEARLFADLARCYFAQKTWNLPELKGKHFVLGHLRTPFAAPVDDCLSRAARGWQKGLNR